MNLFMKITRSFIRSLPLGHDMTYCNVDKKSYHNVLSICSQVSDIDEKFEIQLEKDYDNFDEHVVEEAHYSFEIELPITKANREALGFVDVFDV